MLKALVIAGSAGVLVLAIRGGTPIWQVIYLWLDVQTEKVVSGILDSRILQLN